MQYTKQNQRRVLTHSPIFLERKHHKNVDFMGENKYYKVDAAVCPQRYFYARYFNRCMLTYVSVLRYSKSPSLALGTYFAPRMSLYQELPYGVSRCLLLDISPFSPLCMHRKAHTRRFIRIADNRKER